MPTPQIIAHRGARADAPENTLPAFQEAINQNADGIELDVTLSADGHIIVIHDDTLNRTTTKSGNVRDLSLAEIKSADAGLPFSTLFEGTQVPTLDEVFDSFGRAFSVINVELKGLSPGKSALPGNVITCIKRHTLTAEILISSFNPFLLRQVKRLAPTGLVRIGYLTAENDAIRSIQHALAPVIGPYDARHPHFATVNADYMAQAAKNHYSVNVWTVNDEADIQSMVRTGVSGIITDKPAFTRQIISGE